jgi:biopolymer transport protein ExbB
MESNMPLMKVLVPMCPLLGLVGTVMGMLDVFDSMALLGSADARTLASGVSKAMNCTMTGLAVSVSGMYPVFYFKTAIQRQTELLTERFKF